jgi:hypothetical protein
MKPAKIGVVIVSFNAAAHIDACLSSIVGNRYPRFSVVVVDNASADKTVPLVKNHYPQVHLIANEQNLGFARGGNLGISWLLDRESCGYILLLNDDTVADKKLLERLLQPMLNQKNIGISGPIITYYDQPDRVWFAGGYFNEAFCFTRHPHLNKNLREIKITDAETDFISGACLMIKREVFEQIGLLDEMYDYYFEDVFFCRRAKKAGYGSFLVAQPLIRHRVSTSAGVEGSNRMTPFRAYYYARNPCLFLKRNAKGWRKISGLAGQFLIRFPFYLLQTLKKRDFTSLAAYLRGLRHGLTSPLSTGGWKISEP